MSADIIYVWANWALVGALLVGVLATYAIVVSGNSRDKALKRELATAAERTAQLEQEAAVLRLQLAQEVSKRAPRVLTEEQKSDLLSEWKGKIPEINVIVQRDPESDVFAIQLEIVLQESGAIIHPYKMLPGESMPAPAGLVMYRPGGSKSEDELAEDPLYRGLKKAKLFGGFAGSPFLSLEKLSTGPVLDANQYAIYVGQKPPW